MANKCAVKLALIGAICANSKIYNCFIKWSISYWAIKVDKTARILAVSWSPTCQKRLFVTHTDSIYTKWQGDEAMFLSRRALTPGRDHIASSLIHNPDTIKTWQAHSWCSDIPAIPSSPCLISDLRRILCLFTKCSSWPCAQIRLRWWRDMSPVRWWGHR